MIGTKYINICLEHSLSYSGIQDFGMKTLMLKSEKNDWPKSYIQKIYYILLDIATNYKVLLMQYEIQ